MADADLVCIGPKFKEEAAQTRHSKGGRPKCGPMAALWAVPEPKAQAHYRR